MRADLERAQRLLQRLLEGAPNRHRLADRFHLRAQLVDRAAKFLEREARNLGHHVVDRRLEARRRHARDVVGNLVEPVTDRQPRRDLRDRKSGRLRRQRRAARHARIHLDHDHPPRRRLDRELDIRTSGIDADLANDPNRRVAHQLIFLVGQRLRGRDRDRIAGMHAHRIQILDRANDHDVVGRVAHHLELEFLPSLDRLLDQHFVARRLFEPVRHLGAIFVELARDRSAGPAERSRRPNDQRDPSSSSTRSASAIECAIAERGTSSPILSIAFLNSSRSSAFLIASSFAPISSHLNRSSTPASASSIARFSAVCPPTVGSSASGRSRSMILRQHRHRHRLDIGAIGQFRIGHDRRRIRIDENQPQPFLAQRLDRLRARVVELARLPDNDRPRANQQNRFQIFTKRQLGNPNS